jgi:hypothetical protein
MSEVVQDRSLQEDLRHRSVERARSFSWRAAARSMLNLILNL